MESLLLFNIPYVIYGSYSLYDSYSIMLLYYKLYLLYKVPRSYKVHFCVWIAGPNRDQSLFFSLIGVVIKGTGTKLYTIPLSNIGFQMIYKNSES